MALVPVSAGVPAVLGGNLASQIALIQQDALGVLGAAFSQSSLWGLYRNGTPVITANSFSSTIGNLASSISATAGLLINSALGLINSVSGNVGAVADNVISFGYRQDYEVADYPLEQGGFQSYNKVAKPFELKVSFSTGGSLARREALLNAIDNIVGDTNLYDFHTPEAIYSSVNVTHYDFERTNHNGVGLIKIDVFLQEIRVGEVQASFSNTSQPQSADSVDDGVVQVVAPSSSQLPFSSLWA